MALGLFYPQNAPPAIAAPTLPPMVSMKGIQLTAAGQYHLRRGHVDKLSPGVAPKTLRLGAYISTEMPLEQFGTSADHFGKRREQKVVLDPSQLH